MKTLSPKTYMVWCCPPPPSHSYPPYTHTLTLPAGLSVACCVVRARPSCVLHRTPCGVVWCGVVWWVLGYLTPLSPPVVWCGLWRVLGGGVRSAPISLLFWGGKGRGRGGEGKGDEGGGGGRGGSTQPAARALLASTTVAEAASR